MAMLTVRNLPDDAHRALRVQAALHGRSTEAEVREILAAAVKPDARVRLGDALSALGRKVGLTNEDFAAFQRAGDMLAQTLEGLMGLFRDRVLPFDIDAARHYAELAVTARIAGRGFPTPAGYVAAIATSRGFIVASRGTAPYEAAGVTVINPWQA